MTTRDDSETEALTLLGDDPIEDTDADRFGRTNFAERMVALLDNVANQTPSAAFGLIGPWGSGKTSVLHLARTRLRRQDNWSVVRFNPWEVSNLPSLVHEFLVTVASALPDEGSPRKTVAAYARKLAPYGSLLSTLGVDASTAVEALANQIDDESLETRRDELEEALKRHKLRIAVLIDDVDRLHADELAVLLKLVRLVGRLPNVYYVLAYDETTLLDVLGATDVAAENKQRALAYLDKIVQIRLDLPPVPTVRVRDLVDEALQQLIHRYEIDLNREDMGRFYTAYWTSLEPVLLEPRHVKRFFGQIDATYPLVANEVDFVDFLLVTFLRTFYPSAYSLLRHNKEELTGTKIEVGRKPTYDERIANWRNSLAEVGLTDADVEQVMTLLRELFPSLQQYGGSTYGLADHRRVGSSEYFDRYLYLAVPPDDVADADVRAAIDEAASGKLGQKCETILQALRNAPEAVVDKLARFSPAEPARARNVLWFAAQVLEQTPEAGLLGRSRIVPIVWLAHLLSATNIEDPTTIIEELLAETDIRNIARSAKRLRVSKDQEGRELTAGEQGLVDCVIAVIRDHLESQSEFDPEATVDVVGLLLDWKDLAGPEPARDWLHSVLDKGPWTTERFVGLFTGLTVPIGVPDPTPSLGDFRMKELEEFLGLEFVKSRFTPNVDPDSIDWDDQSDTSFDERLRRAHAVLTHALRDGDDMA